MTANQFFNKVTNSKEDIVSKFITLLDNEEIDYCIIGGMGMNTYCEPIITLDFDCVIVMEKIPLIPKILKEKGFKVKKHPHTLEIKSKYSDVRIHIQLDSRYENFLKNAKYHKILGYRMKVASKEDLLIGKIWAYTDTERNRLKKEKDLLDIKRLVEKYPELKPLIPSEVLKI